MERLVKAARGVKAGNVLPQWRAGRWHGARLNARRLARLHSHCHAHGLTVESAVQRLGLPPPTHAHRHQSSAEAIRPLVGAKVMGRVGAMGRVLPPVHERSEARASDRVASTYGGENNEGGGEVVWPYGSIVREDGGVNLRAVPYTVFRELAHVLDDDLLIGGSGSSKSASNSASNSNTTTTTTTPSTTTTTNSQLSTLKDALLARIDTDGDVAHGGFRKYGVAWARVQAALVRQRMAAMPEMVGEAREAKRREREAKRGKTALLPY